MLVGAGAEVCAVHSSTGISYSFYPWRNGMLCICAKFSTKYDTIFDVRTFLALLVNQPIPSMRLHNVAFRSHHMRRLLHKIGVLLPVWMDGQSLAEASRHIEELCWSHLGYVQRPIFDGHLPPFMMTDANGDSVSLSMPTDPKVLAFKLAAAKSPPLVDSSPASANLSALARLLNLSPFESQWILWSYCVRRFGRAILPTVPLCNQEHGCEVLAMLSEIPVGDVRDAVASRRLHTWGFLDGISTDGEMPPLLSGWLSATDQFADWIEQPYASDSELLTALCQAQVSLTASR